MKIPTIWRRISLTLVVLAALWAIWAHVGIAPEEPVDLWLDQVVQVDDTASCNKNIVGMQPYMVPGDYVNAATFEKKMRQYFEAARAKGFFGEKTIVLLPEYLGTWLVIAGEKGAVTRTEKMQTAMAVMILSHPFDFIRAYASHGGEADRIAASLFRMKSEEMAAMYGNVFRKLASDYQVSIVAGSIVLPAPRVIRGEITVDPKGQLYNVSFVFYPDGSIDPKPVYKAFPITSELPFISAVPPEKIPAFQLAGSNTTVLVCADSWYPQAYQVVEYNQSDVVLVPSFCTGDQTMSKMWKGYDGSELPADVQKDDVGSLTEGAAWEKYALPGRLLQTHARVGVNVFLRGALWELGSDGQPFFMKEGKLLSAPTAERAGIWNLCY